MNLLTPIAGFLIGYGGIMGYQVIDSTYKGEMPGPKSFGYFIGGMTLLSAATIYALGRTDKVFNAGGLSQFTPNELTQSSAIHGDFDHASLNYSGHQNMILRGESFAVDVIHRKEGIEVGDNSIANEYQCGECDSVYDNSSDATICCKCSSCDEPIHEGDCIKYAETFNVEFDADGNYNDFIEDMEGVMGKYGEMKDFDSGYNPQDNLLKARMVVEVDDEDFDNVDFDAESFGADTTFIKWFEESESPYCWTCGKENLQGHFEGVDNICEPCESKWIYDEGGPEGEGYYLVSALNEEQKNHFKMDAENYEVTFKIQDADMATFYYTTDAPSGLSDEEIVTYVWDDRYEIKDDWFYLPYDWDGVGEHYYAKIISKTSKAESYNAEMMMPEKQCVICGGPYTGYGHNPEPIFPMSHGRCCDTCNATVVIPYRLGGMNFRFGEDFEAQTVRKFRNRFDKTSPRGNRRSRAATGVKRNIWKNFFRKDAEDMPDELDMVMAQLYEIEDMKNPTPEDLTNYQNLLTRYYEMVSFNAEQKTARVRTMSGKPVSETLRKLKQDKNLSAKDARTRKEIKAEGELEYEGNCSWCKKPSVKVREVEYGGGGSICPNCHHSYRKLGYNPHKPPHPFKKGAENMEVFEAFSHYHDTYMKILSQVIKNYDSSSASKDAQLINRYGLTTMKRFMKWAESINYSTYYCFTDVARDWLQGAEISSDDMKDIKALLRNLTDEKAKYQLATKVAKENSDLARIYNWTTDSQHKDVISLDKWDEDQFVIDFLATEEETEYYYSQERLTLGSKNVSMILNLGDYEDEDDEATFFDELNPKSGKIPRNLPNTASLLDYLETNAEQFENMLYHNDGLRNFKILRDLYGWSFAIHPAQKYIYEENDEIYIEWQLKRAIPAKKRQQIKLDAQKQIREVRAKLLF